MARQNLTLHILSGDRETAVAETARALGVAHYRAQAMPEDKLNTSKPCKEVEKVLMIGDGINDGPFWRRQTYPPPQRAGRILRGTAWTLCY